MKLPVNLFSFCLACLSLSGFENRNGWTFFVGALVSPLLTALYFVVFPFNPYRTPAAKFSGMYDKDKNDRNVQTFRGTHAIQFCPTCDLEKRSNNFTGYALGNDRDFRSSGETN